MTLDAFVEHVGEVLGRAHSLFGEPPKSGRAIALESSRDLADASASIGGGLNQALTQSGVFATDYSTFGGTTVLNLDQLAANDQRLSDNLREAAHADRTGRAASGRVINNASADTSILAPYTNTPAGQRALITALRARLTHQQEVITAYKRRDAAMASMLRSIVTTPTRSPGSAGSAFGGGGFAPPLSRAAVSPPHIRGAGMGRPSPTHRDSDADAVLASRTDPRAASVPSGPGGQAAAAALSERGKPYVWGAKGPNSFDCSGLTQWAWAHAGVRLGADTYSQVQQGIPVAPGDVRAGDLIFPKGSWDNRGPGHVQLAISATEVVHAPQTGDVVRIAPMPGAFVARRPVPIAPAEN